MDALGVVAHQPGEPMLPRQGVDERSEAHPLHDAPYGDLAALLGGHSHGVTVSLELIKCLFVPSADRRVIHPRLRLYMLRIFMYLWISGHCAATAAPAPTINPNNNSFFMISPPY